ncbi:cytochrome C oxidase subunit IV family protein [Aridibaculum aurantiacum]|uniref:cytochrome C oxidase subunit IV family protein n=1 Tax=Aridibaculum aurantiacum TaxID=2810307 RepID=UPI001A977851|nr:cytochrome C oxidase subunit IV family protein [Aridibaculum aurantiacum]
MAQVSQTSHIGEHKENKNEVRNVTIILSVLTIVELILGYWMYVAGLQGFLQIFIKGVIIILMLAKAFYIVTYFMHLGHEIKNLIMTIVVPLALFIWFIIAFLYDGNSYKNLRNQYDRHHYEESNKTYNTPQNDEKAHGQSDKAVEKGKKPQEH